MTRPCEHHDWSASFPGESAGDKTCPACWLVHNRPENPLVRAWKGRPVAPKVATDPGCSFRGEPLTGPERQAAGLSHTKQWFRCLNPDKPLGEFVCPCQGCNLSCPGHSSKRPKVDADPPASRVVIPGLPDHFNGSIAEFGGKLYLASRKVSRCFLSELERNTFRPLRTAQLKLPHPACPHGQEDPRLFAHAGKLHVGFVGLLSVRRRLGVGQFYAEIDPESLSAGAVRHVRYGGPVEKNWGWFERDGALHAVYSIAPHKVLRIDGEQVSAVHETPNPFPWSGGHLRGGAPPVRVGDEYHVWFHGASDEGGTRTYSVGFYAFEARPPFRILRQSPTPLLWAKPSDAHPKRPGARVVFPAGAVRVGSGWLVSTGVADRLVHVCRWPDESARAGEIPG